MDEISADDLWERLERGEDVRVVDIRSPAEFARRHIPGSVNIPFEEIPNRVAELDDAAHVVTVCPHGKASIQAGQLISSYEGTQATVQSLSSGIDDWPYEFESDHRKQDGTEPTEEAPF